MSETRILLGVLGRPHGVRGLLHVQSYTADPRDLVAYGPLLDEAGRTWSLAWRGDGIAEVRDAEGRPVTDRDAAARLTNTRLFIDRDRLPPPDEEEFYLADLVGLQAVAADGTALGRVAVVHDYGAGTSLEIAGAAAPVIVPFTRACVPEVDVAGGRIVVALPAEIAAALPEDVAALPGELEASA